jgi:putative flippase GtrA
MIPAAMFRDAARDGVARIWRVRFFRFVAVGILNTAIGYAVYVSAVWSGIPYEWALAVPTFLLALVNFFTTGGIVFENKKLSRILPFVAAYGGTLLLNLALLTTLINKGFGKEIAQALLLPVVVPLSFGINRCLVFREQR